MDFELVTLWVSSALSSIDNLIAYNIFFPHEGAHLLIGFAFCYCSLIGFVKLLLSHSVSFFLVTKWYVGRWFCIPEWKIVQKKKMCAIYIHILTEICQMRWNHMTSMLVSVQDSFVFAFSFNGYAALRFSTSLLVWYSKNGEDNC